MSYQESKLYSILKNKCPHCHEGNFFQVDNPYDLGRFSRMNQRCPVCDEDFRREPGYYFGATYVSYGLTVAFGIALYMFFCVLLNFETIPFLVTFGTILLVMMPIFYRFSRLIWINMFVNYKKTDHKMKK